MLIKRILAQFVDILIYFLINGAVFVLLAKSNMGNLVTVLLALVLIHVVYVGIQFPFYKVGQSIGKGFFRLYVVPTSNEAKITPSFMLMREVMFKVLTCYMSCLPALWKAECLHDKSCHTKVIQK